MCILLVIFLLWAWNLVFSSSLRGLEFPWVTGKAHILDFDLCFWMMQFSTVACARFFIQNFFTYLSKGLQ